MMPLMVKTLAMFGAHRWGLGKMLAIVLMLLWFVYFDSYFGILISKFGISFTGILWTQRQQTQFTLASVLPGH